MISSKAQSNNYVGYLFILPSLILIFIIIFYPVFYAFRLSVVEVDFLKIKAFVGLENYQRIFFDPVSRTYFFNTFKYVGLSLFFALLLGLVLALALSGNNKYIGFFRTVICIPWVISQAVTAMLWAWLLDVKFGPINYLLEMLGLEPIRFLSDPELAMNTVIMANVWRSYPFAVILILAALQSVPNELYESAKVDGATGLSQLVFITIPLISGTLFVTTVMLTIEYFNMVTLIYVMTGGGPIGVTEVLSVHAFKEGFWHWRLHYAAAYAVVILVMNILFSVAYMKLVPKDIY